MVPAIRRDPGLNMLHPAGTDLLDDPVVPDYGVFHELNVRSGYVVLVLI